MKTERYWLPRKRKDNEIELLHQIISNYRDQIAILKQIRSSNEEISNLISHDRDS
jgi:hypothetical protein